MRSHYKEQLAREVADWHHGGQISSKQRDALLLRYDSHGAAFAGLLKWLGIFAMLLLGMSVIGFLVAMAQSKFGGALILGVLSWFSIQRGVKLATATPLSHPFTGSLLTTVGIMASYGFFCLIYLNDTNYGEPSPYFAILYLTAAISGAIAYRFRMRFPLLLGLLCLFHAVGASHSYAGRGTYFANIQDERLMAVFAALVIGVGVYHERILEVTRLRRHVDFGALYIKFGLLYFNMSLLFMTIKSFDFTPEWNVAMTLLTIATLAQIVIGAWLKDARFTGYGVVFLSIHLYTRFFEHFWHSWSGANIALVCGGATLLLGIYFERLSKRTGFAAQGE